MHTDPLFSKPTTPLVAQIRLDSKYASQGRTQFRVSIEDCRLGYVVKGGPGGRYRLRDVHLFTETHSGKLIQIS